MAKNNKVYNINAMRPAFVKMRETGNRGVISKKVCSELGISETYFDWYKKSIESLFEAVCAYCRLKNSPKATADEVNAAHEEIYPRWKDMLSTAERDKMTRELRVTEHDISNLVSFCQVFVNDKNDTSRGTDESFVARKVWAVQPLKQFQKKVEIDLGIRIAQVDVLTDEQRDFLRAESRILNQWKKAERRISEITANKERLSALKSKVKGDEAKDLLDEQIADIDAQIATLTKKTKNLQKQHDELLNPLVEAAKDAADAAKAKKPARRTRKSKKSASKTTDEVSADAAEPVVAEKSDKAA